MKNQEKMSIDKLHPFLKCLYGAGTESQLALAESIKNEGDERTALNLTFGLEDDMTRPFMVKPHQVNRWRVHLGTEKGGVFTGSGTSFGLTDVANESEGLRHLEIIAAQLYQICLPYKPALYMESKKVE